MNLDLTTAASLIGPDATLLLSDVAGRTILNVSGRLWITQKGDYQDYFLEAGQRFTVDRPGDTVLQAVGGRAAVVLLDPPTARAPGGEARDLAEAVDRAAAARARERPDSGRAATFTRESIEDDARLLRAAAIAHLTAQVAKALRRGWRALAPRMPPAAAARYAAPSGEPGPWRHGSHQTVLRGDDALRDQRRLGDS